MPYEILRTSQVAAALRGMSAREKRSYEAARDALRSEGCKAGGYRLAAADGDDYPAAALAEVLPSLATVGRRRSDKPPCCENPTEPPVMNEELWALLSAFD